MKTPSGYTIDHMYLSYVPPFPKDKQPLKLRNEVVKTTSQTTDYLFNIFDAANTHAKIEIIFNATDKQENVMRNNILAVIAGNQKSKILQCHKLADKLYTCSDGRNGTGLFIVMQGTKNGFTRFVLIRFKGNEGLVSSAKKSLVGYVSEIFTRNSAHYKMTVYQDLDPANSFWRGFSVDKQLSGSSISPSSKFWVADFLDSTTAITSAQGTLQFSKLIKNILGDTLGISDQEEIIGAIINMRNHKNENFSLAAFCSGYLTEELRAKVKEACTDEFYHSVFAIDKDIFQKELGRTALSMEGGIVAFVPTFNYDKHVTETENVDGSKDITIKARLTSKKIRVNSNN